MRAVDYHLHPKKGLVLSFQCEKCGFVGTNVSAREDDILADDFDQILALKKT
jgi:hypothetical protein